MDDIVDTVRKLIDHGHRPWQLHHRDGSQARRLHEAMDMMESWPCRPGAGEA